MDRAIGLVRVSQRVGDASEHSPEVQTHAMTGYAQVNDWMLDARDIWDENVDTNGKVRKVSGSWVLADRPRLAAAIEAIEAGTHQILLSEHFDRLFRNLDVQRETINRIEAAGGQVWSVTMGRITHATASGKMVATVQGAANEYVRDTAKERSWAAVEIAIEQGKSPSPTPPGYVKGEDGVLTPGEPGEVKVVQEAFALRAGGASAHEVREFLAKHGIKRSLSGVQKMLRSRLYVGEVHFGKPEPGKKTHTPNLQAHEAIIDRDVFDQVQKMVVSAGRKAKSERLLARLRILVCGSCGGRMSTSQTGTGYPFYRCANVDCTRPVTIGAERIERAAIEAVIEHRRSEKKQARGEQEAREAEDAAVAAQEAYRKAQRILADSEDEEEARAILVTKREDRDRKRELAERLAAAYPPVVTVDVERVFRDGTLEDKRAAVRNAIERISIAPGHGPRITIDLLGQ